MENKQKHKKVSNDSKLALAEALNDNLKAQIAKLEDTIARQQIEEIDAKNEFKSLHREFFNQGIELQRAQADADAFEKEAHSLKNQVETLKQRFEIHENEIKEFYDEREKFLDIFNEQNSEIFRLKEEVASLRYQRRYGNWWNRLFRVLNKA